MEIRLNDTDIKVRVKIREDGIARLWLCAGAESQREKWVWGNGAAIRQRASGDIVFNLSFSLLENFGNRQLYITFVTVSQSFH